MSSKISTLIDKIQYNELGVPEFQREHVWSRDQAKELMTTLYKGWPSGSLLFWKTEMSDSLPLRNPNVTVEEGKLITVILDGQQRLTTIYLIIKGEIPRYYTEKDIGKDPRDLYFNLLTGEFKYYKIGEMKDAPEWNKVSDLFKANDQDIERIVENIRIKYDGALVALTAMKKYTTLKNILSYEYPIQELPSTASQIDSVTLFDRVNTQGTYLTKVELALAHMQVNWKTARKDMKSYITKCDSTGFHFDLDFLVKCMVAVVKRGVRPELIHDSPLEELMIGWEKVKNSVEYLINLLPKEAYIDSLDDLSSDSILIPMIRYLSDHNYKFNDYEKKNFFYWLFLASLWSRYSYSPESNLDRDVRIVEENVEPWDLLVSEIIRNRGRIEVQPSDVAGIGIQSGIHKTMGIVAKSKGAVDWFLGTQLSRKGEGHFHLEYHHIFPLSRLYQKEYGGYDSQNQQHKEVVNEIANRAFLTQKANSKIRNSLPEDYLPEIVKNYPGALESQFVPVNPDLWTMDQYEEFLEIRRRLIADEINTFFNNIKVKERKEINIDDIITKGEGQYIEFKSSLRIDLDNKGLNNKQMEFQVAKAIAGFLNTQEGGNLFIGVKDDGTIIGLENDYNSIGEGAGSDIFQQRVHQVITSNIGETFNENIKVDFHKIDLREICHVQIKKSYKPAWINKNGIPTFYVRIGNRTVPMDIKEVPHYVNRIWK